MHAIEKIMAKNSGKTSVKAGDIVTAKVDFAAINDLYPQTMYSFREMGGKKVWDSSRAAFIFDHYAPCPSIKTATTHQEMRNFAKEHGLEYHFDTNCGVCHQVLAESGLSYPGEIIIVTDSHTTTHGAFGAFGTGVGATDMACILMEGELWMRVPEIMEIRLNGEAPKGVYPKDVILNILGDLKADGAVYRAVEFTGEYIENLGIPGRMTICNMALELGAKTAYMQPNKEVLDYVSERAVRPFEVQYTDEDFVYAETHVYDVSKMQPAVACPDSVDNVCSIEEAEAMDIKLDQAYLGSCTNGRLEDIAIAASILGGRHIPKFARLIVVPASADVLNKASEAGYIKTLTDAGATIVTPGCAACLGTHEGILAPGENCISCTNRNFKGRMGSGDAKLYLASPATVAASILEGKITDPRKYL